MELPARHRTREFESEMTLLHEHLEAMSLRCRMQVRRALNALWAGSQPKKADVAAGDSALDFDEKSIDALILRVLAQRQPVAHDLRLLTASFKIVTDLERIGDEAVTIATASAPTDASEVPSLRRLAEKATELLEAALRAFLDGDIGVASRVRRDGAIASLYDAAVTDAVRLASAAPANAATALGLVTVAKALERIASHAMNVADGALFAFGEVGQMPR